MDQAEQVEQFIAMLRNTSAQAEDGVHHLESDSAGLDHLAPDVHEHLAGLSHELEGVLAELASDDQTAISEIENLASAAHTIADARFAAALDHLEHAESAVNQSLESVRNELDQDSTGLHDQGFQPFAATLHSADAAVDASRSEADSAFNGLDAALHSLTSELHTSTTEVDHALIAAAAVLGDEDKHGVETDAGECLAGVHELGPDLDAESGTVGDEMQHLYDGWAAEVETEGHQLEESLTTLYDGSAEAITVAGTEKIAEPSDKIVTEAIPALTEELDEQLSMLGAAHETAAELPPLAADLEIAVGVVDHINELVKAMDE